jgi:hypothetical protein
MNYVVALPSYNRTKTLSEKTMALLERHAIQKDKIHIFVSDVDQAKLYNTSLPGYKVIVGCIGLCNIRNFITEYFPEDTPILFMDDDVSELYTLHDNSYLLPLTNLDTFVTKAFTECKNNKRSMWGIYPVKNPFWMKYGFTTDYKFCIGHMYGVFNRHAHKIVLDYKEDYERTLLYCTTDGGVIRFNDTVAKTKMGAKGGLDTIVAARLTQNKKSCALLISQYPAAVRLNGKRDGEIIIKNPKKIETIS